MKNSIIRWFTAALAAAILLAVAGQADAQGRYSGRYSNRDVSTIISDLERSSREFRADFDRYLDQSSLNGTREEDRLNRIVQNYDNALRRLRSNFDSSDSWWRSRSNVQSVMNEAGQVNTMMNSLPFARQLERQWNQMRRDLNRVADTYDLPELSGGGGGGGWQGGGGGGNAPSWAVGTFYGRNPWTGGVIALDISRNGRVTATFDGRPSYGTINGSTLQMEGATARVTQLNNGIRTRRTDNGETIDYYRGTAGGPIGGNVPNWAVGTFYGRNPQTGGRITLTIEQNGQVYVDLGGGRNDKAYGTIYGTTLTVNNETATVRRMGNGIRTTRTDNGQWIDYTRDGSGGGWDGGGQPGGPGMGDVPNWAVGTFFAQNPTGRGSMSISIERGGRVTVNINGNVIYGTMYRDRLNINGETAVVTQLRNGIRTRRPDTGETIDYYRQ